LEILAEAKKIFSALPTLQDIHLDESEKLTIVGDIHGQLKVIFYFLPFSAFLLHH